MSGREEKPRQEGLVCPHCGYEVFEQVIYGYQIQYYNPTTGEEWDRGWGSNDYEDWQCAECNRTVLEEMRERLTEMIFR